MSNAVTIALHEKQELTLESLSRSAFSPQRLVEHVLVLSSDERSQALALKTGLAATFTHDYKRTVHRHVVCIAQRGRRHGHKHPSATTPTPGGAETPQVPTPSDKHLRLIVGNYANAQPRPGAGLAQAMPSNPGAFYPDKHLVAQYGGEVLSRHHHQTTALRLHGVPDLICAIDAYEPCYNKDPTCLPGRRKLPTSMPKCAECTRIAKSYPNIAHHTVGRVTDNEWRDLDEFWAIQSSLQTATAKKRRNG